MRRVLVFLMLGACSGDGGKPFEDGGVDATAKPDVGSDVTALGDAFATDTGPGDDADAGADVQQQNPDLDCLTDDAGCVSCCFDRHPDGSATYFDTLTNCACHVGATCHSATVCLNNLCKGNNPSTACDTCLSNPDAGDCYNVADNACSNDNDCVAFFDCALNVCSPPPADASTD